LGGGNKNCHSKRIAKERVIAMRALFSM